MTAKLSRLNDVDNLFMLGPCPSLLPQLTRREFLKRAALAGVGLGLVEPALPKS